MPDRSQLPEPLTPEHCDLRSHTYFPLHYDRLLRSRWWRRASDLARSRNMDLWSHAFREVPAASLPDDDADLADYAGFGRDIDAFQQVKSELMAPWVLCSDGRWYHPTLAEVACELWDRLDSKRKANAARQNNRRKRLRGEAVTAHEADENEVVTRDTTPPSRVTGGSEQGAVTPHSGPKEIKETNNPLTPRGGSSSKVSDEDVEACWVIASPQSRKRSSKAELRRALEAAVKRGHTVAAIALGLGAYFASPDATKKDGSMAKGVHRMVQNDRWSSYQAAAPVPDEPEPNPDDLWRRRVGVFTKNLFWPEDAGPRPGRPGCRVPDAILAEFAALLAAPQERAA